MKVVKSQFEVMSPGKNGQIILKLADKQMHIFEVQITCDESSVINISTTTNPPLAGQMGTQIDPTGRTGKQMFQLANHPDYKRMDDLNITFRSSTNRGRIYVWYSYLDNQ